MSDWEQSAQGALALLILLDQFPRNMFRGSARMFVSDPLALAIAAGAIVRGFDAAVDKEVRGFFICRSNIPKIPPTRRVRSHFIKQWTMPTD